VVYSSVLGTYGRVWVDVDGGNCEREKRSDEMSDE
jgi:hypothetical protein